jgi:hypothetical protein
MAKRIWGSFPPLGSWLTQYPSRGPNDPDHTGRGFRTTLYVLFISTREQQVWSDAGVYTAFRPLGHRTLHPDYHVPTADARQFQAAYSSRCSRAWRISAITPGCPSSKTSRSIRRCSRLVHASVSHLRDWLTTACSQRHCAGLRERPHLRRGTLRCPWQSLLSIQCDTHDPAAARSRSQAWGRHNRRAAG